MNTFNIEVLGCENGFLVVEGNTYQGNRPFISKKWVAKTPKDLGELVEKLAGEQVKRETNTPD